MKPFLSHGQETGRTAWRNVFCLGHLRTGHTKEGRLSRFLWRPLALTELTTVQLIGLDFLSITLKSFVLVVVNKLTNFIATTGIIKKNMKGFDSNSTVQKCTGLLMNSNCFIITY